jgi:hypothetical protein
MRASMAPLFALLVVGCAVNPAEGEADLAVRSDALETIAPVHGVNLDVQIPPSQESDEDPELDGPVIHHPGQFPSLQAAVDTAPDGAVIRLSPGTYYEALTLTGKSLTVVGAGAGATRLDGANVFGSLVTLGAGAHLRLRHLALSTGHDAITSAVDPPRSFGARPKLDLQAIVVAGNGNGGAIHGTFQRVIARNASLFDLDIGLVLSSTPKVVLDSVTVDAQKTGLYIDNRKERGNCITRVSDTTIRGREKGGLVVLGSKTTVQVERVTVHDSAIAGIGLFGVRAATLSFVRVERTAKRPDSMFGNGLIVWGSNATMSDSTIAHSAGAGILATGCAGGGLSASLSMARTTLSCNALDMSVHTLDEVAPTVTCGPGSVTLDDLGGNACSQQSSASCATDRGACRAQTTELAPIHPY